jgi:hypothetical protein
LHKLTVEALGSPRLTPLLPVPVPLALPLSLIIRPVFVFVQKRKDFGRPLPVAAKQRTLLKIIFISNLGGVARSIVSSGVPASAHVDHRPAGPDLPA